MKTLYGSPKIEHKSSANGAPVSGDWVEMQSPKDGTATLDTPEGTDNELKNEKGKVLDSYTEPGVSTLTFELVKEKGKAFPFPVVNGNVPGEHAIRISNNNDASAPAVQLDRCTLTGRILWSKGDALRMAYKAKVLEPASGEDVKILGVDVDKTSLAFDATADTTGKTVTAQGNGTITAASDQTWATVAVTNGVVTVAVTANTGTARSANVTISDGTGYSTVVTVTQAASA